MADGKLEDGKSYVWVYHETKKGKVVERKDFSRYLDDGWLKRPFDFRPDLKLKYKSTLPDVDEDGDEVVVKDSDKKIAKFSKAAATEMAKVSEEYVEEKIKAAIMSEVVPEKKVSKKKLSKPKMTKVKVRGLG